MKLSDLKPEVKPLQLEIYLCIYICICKYNVPYIYVCILYSKFIVTVLISSIGYYNEHSNYYLVTCLLLLRYLCIHVYVSRRPDIYAA